jgi:hypothetical protein
VITERQVAEAIGRFVRSNVEAGFAHPQTATALSLFDVGIDPDAARAAWDYARCAFPGQEDLAVVLAAGVVTGLGAGALAVRDAENGSHAAEEGS